jgi:aryl-alcohol dehydrogenase-like predicted oxidoreductase
MRKGFTAFSANKDIDLALRAKVLAAESLMKWRRLVLFTVGDYQRRFIVSSKMNRMTRRKATKLIGVGSGALLLPMGASHLFSATEPSSMLTRTIPSSGEKLSVIGLGTWNVFDVDLTPENEKNLGEVLSHLVKSGGSVIDSSPMYGRAEEVVGALATKLGLRDKLFLATKVWTRGKEAGIESMERSMSRLQTKRIDLMQVHNLVDVSTQLSTMRDWKTQGRFRYIGITHYNSSAFSEVEKVLRSEKVDFLQINYSIMEHEAEKQILPLAQDRGVAVIINRPFGGGNLFSRVRSKPLPDWAAEIDCHSWAQFFLKWIIAHPAVTCAIPATNNPGHLEDNMQAGIGRLPDAKTRQRMADLAGSL